MTDDKIIRLVQPEGIGEGITITPDQILAHAAGAFAEVVLIGVRHDGSLDVRGSHGAPDIHALLALAQRWMLAQAAALRGWE